MVGVGGGGSTGVVGPPSVKACAAKGAEMEGLLEPMEMDALTKGFVLSSSLSLGPPVLAPASRSRRMGEVASLEDPLGSSSGLRA